MVLEKQSCGLSPMPCLSCSHHCSGCPHANPRVNPFGRHFEVSIIEGMEDSTPFMTPLKLIGLPNFREVLEDLGFEDGCIRFPIL